ncbi:hypothetical protein JRQ81_010454 [Phrynocephalus forsythii]|uniref:Structure-specific endonuclease subunit SLX4 n=1 Tax=Phrynocephalus forsythii TaxID=171643 RepID=A0A9Q1ARI6_9SAUR|nr:hypothetical protein JRQ81_010454 [Phrynocephalus forsythii]
MEVPAALLLQALRRQQQQQQQQQQHRPPPSSASSASPPPAPARSLPSVPPGQPKRKGISSVQNLAKKPKTAPKRDRADEDFMVAMAMSRSLLEKDKAAAKLRTKERKGRLKPPASPPLLLLQNAREMHRDMEERVGQLLSEAAEFPSTPRLPPSHLLERERFRRAAGQPAFPEGPRGSLWEFSSLTGLCLPGNFTATSLALPAPSRLPGTQESEGMLLGASPFQSRDDRAPPGSVARSQQEVSAASQRDVQVLQDLVELAGEGLTLTQWGQEVRQLEEPGQEEEMASTFQTDGFSPGESMLSQRSRPRTPLLDSLAGAFRGMINNPHLSDLQFQVDSGEILYAHMFVLYARCPLLMEAVDCEGFMVSEEGVAWTRRMVLNAVPREAMCVFLSYLYAADSSIPAQVLSDVGALATRFGLTELVAACEGGQPGLKASGKEREGDGGSGDGREKILEELLESMWMEEDHEAQPGGACPAEEAGSNNMSDQDLEEIYQFAATQTRLAQGPTTEGNRPGRGGTNSPQGEKTSLGGEEEGAELTPRSLLASGREVGQGEPLGLGLQQGAEGGRGPFLASGEPSQKEEEEEEECLLVGEGCSRPCPQGPGDPVELSPGTAGRGSPGAQSPSLQQEWAALSPRVGARERPGPAVPAQGPAPSPSPPPGAACARDPPGASPPCSAASLLPTLARRCSSPRSRSCQERPGKELPSRGPEQPPGGQPEGLPRGAGSPTGVVVVVLDSEEEEEEESEGEGRGKRPGSGSSLGSPVGPCWVPEHPSKWKASPGANSSVGPGSPLHLLSPKERAQEPREVFVVTGGSLGKRQAVWGLSSDEEDTSLDEGLMLVPDTPGPSQTRSAGGGSNSGPEEPWRPPGQAGPPAARSPSLPLEPPAREDAPQAFLRSCGPGSRCRLASPGATEEAEATVVILEDSEEEETEEVPVAAALFPGKVSSLPTEPTGAASAGKGLGMLSPAWSCRPRLEWNQAESSEDEGPGWLSRDSDSSDILPLAQRVPSPPAGTPPRPLDPASQAREAPGRTGPQTPMPSYSTMVTPELKKELRRLVVQKTGANGPEGGGGSLCGLVVQGPVLACLPAAVISPCCPRFGVRALPKQQMVLKLREIFQFTHQPLGAEVDETAASCAAGTLPHKRAKALVPSTLPKQATGSVQPSHLSAGGNLFGLGSWEDPSPGGKARPGRCSVQDGSAAPSFSAAACPLGSSTQISNAPHAAPQRPAPSSLAWGSEAPVASQSSSSVVFEAQRIPASQALGLETDKLEALQHYIHSTPALCRQLLLYQPIELAGLQAELKEKGIRVSLRRLLDFLDTHCITFTTAEARREKRTPRKGRRRC